MGSWAKANPVKIIKHFSSLRKIGSRSLRIQIRKDFDSSRRRLRGLVRSTYCCMHQAMAFLCGKPVPFVGCLTQWEQCARGVTVNSTTSNSKSKVCLIIWPCTVNGKCFICMYIIGIMWVGLLNGSLSDRPRRLNSAHVGHHRPTLPRQLWKFALVVVMLCGKDLRILCPMYTTWRAYYIPLKRVWSADLDQKPLAGCLSNKTYASDYRLL